MNLKPFLLLVPHMTAIASDKNHEIENLIRAEGAYHTLTVFYLYSRQIYYSSGILLF